MKPGTQKGTVSYPRVTKDGASIRGSDSHSCTSKPLDFYSERPLYCRRTGLPNKTKNPAATLLGRFGGRTVVLMDFYDACTQLLER